jgi:hypothetical protein
MDSEVARINERFKKARIGLKDTLAVIDMTLEGQLKDPTAGSPYEVFSELNELIGRTVHGTKIERFKPQEDAHPFHTFEVHTGRGEALEGWATRFSRPFGSLRNTEVQWEFSTISFPPGSQPLIFTPKPVGNLSKR